MSGTGLVATIGFARDRWQCYVADCNPVEELDQYGRTLDQAIADRVLAYFGLKTEATP